MRSAAALALMLALATPAAAQEGVSAPGGVLRLLDKITGELVDLDLSAGQSAGYRRLTIRLDDCRYPAADPASDAFAHLTIVDTVIGRTVFSGWMIASSPGLSAMDDPRYDVWVLRCAIPGGTPADSAG